MVELKRKHNFARQHIEAASYFAECSAKVEDQLLVTKGQDKTPKLGHRAYVVGAVVSAVMGLETCINEIYLDACDMNKQKLTGLSEQEMLLLAEWWPHLEKLRSNTLLKYQHALLIVGKKPMSKGENLYQDTDSLIRLRNALTHYRPEWEDSLDVHADLRDRLRGRFVLNRLTTASHLWFPHQCLGDGCARWAVKTAREFVSTFCDRLGIPPRL